MGVIVILENKGSGNKRTKDWLAQHGLENPYDKFCAQLGPFMRAHSKLTKLGDVSFYSHIISEVAQRALRESNEDWNGERENDALTKALQTKEQRGHVHHVSSKLTWKEGFLEYKSMYRKQKMISTPYVDVVELKRQLRREVLGDLRPILKAQGIQLPDIGGVTGDEEDRSSLASTAVGGWPQGEHQAPASGLVEGQEQRLPSIEADTIDNLPQPTSCSHILLVGWSFRMLVKRGIVYPRQTMLDGMEIDISSYVVIKVDMVHENLKDLKLKVPPDDAMLTV
jgi:hypothetical protein